MLDCLSCWDLNCVWIVLSPQGHVNTTGATLECGFTPDSKYIYSGMLDTLKRKCVFACCSPSLTPGLISPSSHLSSPPSPLLTSPPSLLSCPCLSSFFPSSPTSLVSPLPSPSGSQDGTAHVWSAETGEKVTILDGGHPGPTRCVQFNPRMMMMATACNNMASVSDNYRICNCGY